MNNLFFMSVLHRLQDLQEKPQAVSNPEPVGVAPVCQRRALHVLHREVGQSLRVHPGIVETRNMGML